jgi:protein-disulfide isomerase
LSKFRLLIAFTLLFVIASSAQSPNPNEALLNRRIEQKVRTTFNLPQQIDITIGARTPSEIGGYDKVPVTLASGGRKTTHDFLISKDNTTLIEWEKLDLTKDVMSSMDLSGRPSRGNAQAKVLIVNYDDFECPFCAKMHQTLFPDLMKAYGDRVKIVYKDYPLVEIHPWAMHAAVDANCLGAQNNDAYWEFADYAHANQKTINGEKRDITEEYGRLDKLTHDLGQKHGVDVARLDACVSKQDDSAVRASMVEGEKVGVDATPTIFVNGERLSGAVSEDVLRTTLDRALKDAGQTPPPAPAAAAAKKGGGQ